MIETKYGISTPDQLLRYEFLAKTNFNARKAKQCYNFYMAATDTKIEAKAVRPIEEVEIDSVPDGIYLVFNNNEYRPYNGETVSDDRRAEVTGIGVKCSRNAFVVALYDAYDGNIRLTDEECGKRFYDSRRKALNDSDGKANTDDIKADLAAEIVLPTNGYIPALGQLFLIFLWLDKINEALNAVNGQKIKEDFYWSSTQYSATLAWLLYLNDGITGNYTKAAGQYGVRPVSAFLL